MPKAILKKKKAVGVGRLVKGLLLGIAGLFLMIYLGCCGLMVLYKWVSPFTTGVQVQRRVESWGSPKPYSKKYDPVPMEKISRHLQHAVVAAEDTRFFQHNGFDWVEIREAIEDAEDGGRMRGASTITNQLVKNLFGTTARTPVRKAFEWSLTPAAEIILGKQRILALYLNVIEWGPGVYGAEAAARYHYGMSAASLNRDQAARLAAVIPSPRRRRVARMSGYAGTIESRMAAMGW